MCSGRHRPEQPSGYTLSLSNAYVAEKTCHTHGNAGCMHLIPMKSEKFSKASAGIRRYCLDNGSWGISTVVDHSPVLAYWLDIQLLK